MMMFLIKLLSIIVFDLCTNICCIYSMCKNCCKDDAIKETKLRNENFLKLIEFKDDGKVYYNCSSQGFDQIDRDQVDGIVNSAYGETVFFYGINKELYNSITRKSYIKFYGTQNLGKGTKKSVKKNMKEQTSRTEEKGKTNSDKGKEEDKRENNENKDENENNIEDKNEIRTIETKEIKNEGETDVDNGRGKNNFKERADLSQDEQSNDIDETEGDNCSSICLYNDVFKGCEVVMDKFVLFAVKTNDGNCYLGFCIDGNSKENREEGGYTTSFIGLFSYSKVNVEIKMISCGGKLENVQDMFRDNSNLKNIVFTPLFVPLSVTNMTGMFAGCSELDELDLFNFNSASTSEKNQIYIDYMFAGCSKLKKLTFPYLDNTNFHPMCLFMFKGCTSLRKCNLMVNNAAIIDSFKTCSELNMKEKIKSGEKTNKEIKEDKEENEENEENKENKENKEIISKDKMEGNTSNVEQLTGVNL